MTTPGRTTLREWTLALTLNEIDPYAAGETRYVPLDEAGRGAVDELRATIALAFDATTQLLSGPSGSGKSTELLRLRGELRAEDYLVTVVNIKDYVSESAPIDITEFLIALAVAAHDAYDLPVTPETPTFTTRLGRLLRRLKVNLDVAGVQVAASGDAISVGVPGASAEVSLQAELKSSQSFVEDLRSKLSFHVGELHAEVSDYLADLARAAAADNPVVGALLIVDGLEKLQGTTQNAEEVQESIERLFVAHASKLKFPSHHVVYTVPTILLFTNPGALPYEGRVPVPVPSVRSRGVGPEVSDPTVLASRRQLRDVVGRRLPVRQVFGETDELLDQVIAASGGHLRDLFTLLNALISLILRRSLSLPVTSDDIDQVIGQVAYDFSPKTLDVIEFLDKVNHGDGSVVPRDNAEMRLMARLRQQHLLLGHLNGSDWYEVHPLTKRTLGWP